MKSHYIDSLIVVNWAKSLISNIRQISLSSSFYAFIKLSDIITYIFTTFPLLIFILYPSSKSFFPMAFHTYPCEFFITFSDDKLSQFLYPHSIVFSIPFHSPSTVFPLPGLTWLQFVLYTKNWFSFKFFERIDRALY